MSDPKPPLVTAGDAFGRERVDKAPRSKKVTPETHYRTASGDYAPYPRELCQLRLGHEGDHSETPDPTDPRPQLCAEWVESLCTCPEGPYFGTQPAGTRIACERCRMPVYPLGHYQQVIDRLTAWGAL
jgi:hypothetical protein